MMRAGFWLVIFALILAACIAGVIYLCSRIGRLEPVRKLAKGKRWAYRLISLSFILIVFLTCYFTLGAMNATVVILYLILIWILSDIVGAIVNKVSKGSKRPEGKRYVAGYAALAIAVCYLGFAWFTDHHVVMTEYGITAENAKVPDGLRVVAFGDAHLGSTFSGEELAEYVEDINSCDPDVVVIVGDFVDDGTTLEDMRNGCESLGKLDATYGTYYVFGNHDKGYFRSWNGGFDVDDLIENLEANGVHVLQDDAAHLAGNVYLVGRQDASEQDRASAQDLMASLPDDAYAIVADHQPSDYDNEAASGAGLVLSGHTHGGQFLAIKWFGTVMGINDYTYGHTSIGDTDFIVSSGISDWSLGFKTGCKSEFVVVDVR